MPWFEGTHTETRALPVSPEVALAHFADLQAIRTATKGVESAEISQRTIHFVLQEEDYGVVKFKPEYRCTYQADGGKLSWNTEEGANLKQSGEATFTATDGGCEISYTETVQVELEVAAMMAPMLKPVVGPVLAKEVKGYLDRMIEGLPS
ncbi:MAG: SRPBCC family protein [Myxococcales bacterium]|nr:SRPBCC family protein [Myxococcales bacterium]